MQVKDIVASKLLLDPDIWFYAASVTSPSAQFPSGHEGSLAITPSGYLHITLPELLYKALGITGMLNNARLQGGSGLNT